MNYSVSKYAIQNKLLVSAGRTQKMGRGGGRAVPSAPWTVCRDGEWSVHRQQVCRPCKS